MDINLITSENVYNIPPKIDGIVILKKCMARLLWLQAKKHEHL
jgi:hypothetical protein